MSFSITPSDTIRNHPTNTSTSKQVHQFAKTPRFLSNNPEYAILYADVPMPFTATIVNFPIARLHSATGTSQTSPKPPPSVPLSLPI